MEEVHKKIKNNNFEGFRFLDHFRAVYGVEYIMTHHIFHEVTLNVRGSTETCSTYLRQTKEQKSDWPAHLSPMKIAYNTMLHSSTGFQPHDTYVLA